MIREEIYKKLKDIEYDVNILRDKVNHYEKEYKEFTVNIEEESEGAATIKNSYYRGHGAFLVEDILKDFGFIKSELDFVNSNKDELLRVELVGYIEELNENMKVLLNKLKQASLDIKEVYYNQNIQRMIKE